MTAINEHLGKPFSTKPEISINNDIYDYCKSQGTVSVIETGDPTVVSQSNWLGDVCITDGNEIPESQVSIPVNPSLITHKYVLEKAREKFKFKLKVKDTESGETFQIDSAYFEVPKGLNLDASQTLNVIVKGSQLYYL